MTVTRAKIEVTIPRKRRGDCSQHEKGLTKFYEQCVQALLRHVNFDVVKAVIVASPGFVRQQFFDYMYQQVHNRNNACCVMSHSQLFWHTSKSCVVNFAFFAWNPFNLPRVVG